MKNKINKKVLIFGVVICFFLILGVGSIYAQAQATPTAKAIKNRITTQVKASLWERILSFPNNLLDRSTRTQKLDRINNKTIPPTATLVLNKRNLITKVQEVVNGDYILAKNDEFIVSYIPSPDAFIISINKKPTSGVRTKAEAWFIERGFTKADLCSLGIHFIAQVENPSNYDKNLYKQPPTGCR